MGNVDDNAIYSADVVIIWRNRRRNSIYARESPSVYHPNTYDITPVFTLSTRLKSLRIYLSVTLCADM